MKLGLFSDPHYSSHALTCGNRYNSLSLGKMCKALSFFEEQGCDLILCLGDLIDREHDRDKEIGHLERIAQAVSSCSVSFISLMGNHDAFALTPEDFYAHLGQSARPRRMALGNTTLLFLDACHFASGAHYAPGDDDWMDTFYPYAEELKKELASVLGDAVVLLHQNIDPNIHVSHRLSNADQIRKILEESGRVTCVIQGHYHPGAENSVNGIRYLTMPAMCEKDWEDAVAVMEI